MHSPHHRFCTFALFSRPRVPTFSINLNLSPGGWFTVFCASPSLLSSPGGGGVDAGYGHLHPAGSASEIADELRRRSGGGGDGLFCSSRAEMHFGCPFGRRRRQAPPIGLSRPAWSPSRRQSAWRGGGGATTISKFARRRDGGKPVLGVRERGDDPGAAATARRRAGCPVGALCSSAAVATTAAAAAAAAAQG
uniref:Uncharacterized protein n=1 Tax=Steinernema glaseri TaxID=37863 RepID=A0A1I7ZYB4_9BILA